VREPQEALDAARRAAAGQSEEAEVPGYGDPQLSDRRLIEWAILEPEEAKVYSTRRYGRPITVFKRLLVRLLRQYLLEVSAQQSRFNTLIVARVLELGERVEKLEAERARPPRP
jgi:hypothetical protein